MRRFLAQQAELFSVLKYRDFRLFWSGLMAQVAGQRIMMVTIGFLAYELTGSELALGVVTLFQALPRLLLTVVGGAIADRMDQRNVITVVQSANAAIMATLAVLVLTDSIELWHLAGAALLLGTVQTFDEPSRQSLFPHLLPDRSLIPAAVPLNAVVWQVNRLGTPAIAGFVIEAAGADTSAFLAAAGAITMASVMRMVHVERVTRTASPGMFQTLAAGAKYVWAYGVFRTAIAALFVSSLFGMGYQFMLPIFALSVHEVGAVGLGFMFTAAGAGSLTSLFTVGWLVRRFRPGRVILIGIMAFAVCLIGFAAAPSYPIALAFLVGVGYTNALYLTGGQILFQTLVPSSLRGRVMGLNGMTWSLMPLGGALLNGVAEFIGAPLALGLGAGIAFTTVLVVALRRPELWRVTLEDRPAEEPDSVAAQA